MVQVTFMVVSMLACTAVSTTGSLLLALAAAHLLFAVLAAAIDHRMTFARAS